MLESEVHHEDDQGEDERRNQDQDRRTLQLAPGRPRHLLGEFDPRLLQIVYELSHLVFNGHRKIGSGNPDVC